MKQKGFLSQAGIEFTQVHPSTTNAKTHCQCGVQKISFLIKDMLDN